MRGSLAKISQLHIFPNISTKFKQATAHSSGVAVLHPEKRMSERPPGTPLTTQEMNMHSTITVTVFGLKLTWRILCGRGYHNLYVFSSHLVSPNVNEIWNGNGFSLCEASEKSRTLSLSSLWILHRIQHTNHAFEQNMNTIFNTLTQHIQ